MGDDDMFSSDLSDDQLRMRLGHMSNTPCQVNELCICLFIVGENVYTPRIARSKNVRKEKTNNSIAIRDLFRGLGPNIRFFFIDQQCRFKKNNYNRVEHGQ